MGLSNVVLSLAGLSLVVWSYLLFGRRGFWRARPRIEQARDPAPAVWPAVVAVVPARDEAALVERALGSLLAQDYAGELAIVLVDDHSADGTLAIAQRLARTAARPLEVVGAPPLPPGWSGKLWALACGLDHAGRRAAGGGLPAADRRRHRPCAGQPRPAGRAGPRRERLDLVSLMVRLHCASFWERLLVPPFVFFFQLLYPFGAVNDPGSPVAAAAGGCMLVRRQALRAAGGIAAIRGALIDDVALARAIKRRPGGGRIWLGLDDARRRACGAIGRLGEIWAMVARTADVQLRHSLPLLAAPCSASRSPSSCRRSLWLAGLLQGDALAAGAGALAQGGMALAFWPTVRLYRLGAGWALTLPLAAALFGAMTLDSALAVPARRRRPLEGPA